MKNIRIVHLAVLGTAVTGFGSFVLYNYLGKRRNEKRAAKREERSQDLAVQNLQSHITSLDQQLTEKADELNRRAPDNSATFAELVRQALHEARAELWLYTHFGMQEHLQEANRLINRAQGWLSAGLRKA